MYPWYLIMDLVLWTITGVSITWAWPRLNRLWRLSAVMTILLVMILQVLNEWLSLHIFKAWTFSEKYSRLIGVDILGAPLEEYLFWFAFAWMIPFLYSGLAVHYNMQPEQELTTKEK